MEQRAQDAEGRVRPADGRWLGDANDDKSGEQLADDREQQIAENTATRAEQRAAEEKTNQDRLEASGWVNTTTPEYLESERRRLRDARERAQSKVREQQTPAAEADDPTEQPLSEMLEHPEADGAPVVDTTGEQGGDTSAAGMTAAGGDGGEQHDTYDGMQFSDLQQAAKARGLSGAGNADELRARLREADASGNE